MDNSTDTVTHTPIDIPLGSGHAIAFPVLSSIAIVILIVPFVCHWVNRNVGSCALIFCVTVLNLMTFVNALIWPDENYSTWWYGYGLCDVEVKLQWPLATGVSSAILCITRNLANVFDPNNPVVNQSRQFKRRQRIIDALICFLIPFLQLCLHYVVQVNRYYITAVGGCQASFDNSWPTIVIMYMWSIIFPLINCYYTVAVIYRLYKHRSQFSSILANSTSGLTTSRFLRLLIMSLTLLLIHTPLSIYYFCYNINIPWLPYDWAAIHDPEYWPVIILLPQWGSITLNHYVPIAIAVFIFAYFGLGGDALLIYRRWALAIGLGRLFGSLQNRDGDRRPSVSSEQGFLSRFSVVSWAKRRLERQREFSVDADGTSSAHKPSIAAIEHSTSAAGPSHCHNHSSHHQNNNQPKKKPFPRSFVPSFFLTRRTPKPSSLILPFSAFHSEGFHTRGFRPEEGLELQTTGVATRVWGGRRERLDSATSELGPLDLEEGQRDHRVRVKTKTSTSVVEERV